MDGYYHHHHHHHHHHIIIIITRRPPPIAYSLSLSPVTATELLPAVTAAATMTTTGPGTMRLGAPPYVLFSFSLVVKHLHVFSDNDSAVRASLDCGPKAGQRIAKRIRRTAKQWLGEDANRTITIAWIPAHTGIKGNTRADKLAKRGTRKPANKDYTTLTHARRLIRDAALLDWKADWLNAIGRGRSAWANRFPPTWHPRAHFRQTRDDRQAYTHTLQARIGHTHIGEYYAAFNIPETIDSPCGTTVL